MVARFRERLQRGAPSAPATTAAIAVHEACCILLLLWYCSLLLLPQGFVAFKSRQCVYRVRCVSVIIVASSSIVMSRL